MADIHWDIDPEDIFGVPMHEWQRRVFNVFMDGGYEARSRYPQDYEREPSSRFVRDLPNDYIDAGIVLKSSVMITHKDIRDADWEDVKAFQDWVNEMPNLLYQEIPETRVYWVYDTLPCITTLN
jgi:hypothetical protein